MSALRILFDLDERGIELRLSEDGRVIAAPASLLTDEDRAAIRAHRPEIIRLLSSDYAHLPNGWQGCPALASRTVLIHQGRLLDSACFESAPAAADFLRRVLAGEAPAAAFKVASRHPETHK